MQMGGAGGDRGRAAGPIAAGAGAVGLGRGEIGGEPGDDGRSPAGIGIEERLDPREVAERGVNELAVEFAVAGAERAVGGEFLLDAKGQ